MSRLLFLALAFMFLLPPLARAQSVSVSGKVLSAEDESPLIGATVQIQGSNQGAFTDENGQFRLSVPALGTRLEVRYYGFLTTEVTVASEEALTILLEPSVSTVDEVVVVGYGTQKRSQITGAVSAITADEINENKVLRVEQALQGRAAGVQVSQNSGSPGSALTVRIRGIGTINNSDPLYLVDGVIVNGLDFLNPSDIASISVLKDAASTAIYGTQGANGVVLITTKSGKFVQKAEVSYGGYYGVQSPWKLLNLLNSEEYAILQNEARIAAGLPIRPEFANPASLGEGTDWQGAVFTDAPMMSHQLSINGGSERSTYALSGNYFAQEGIVGGEKSAFDRITLRFNNQNQLNDRISVGTRLNFTRLSRNQLPENNEFSTPMIRAINLDPTSPIQDDEGNYLPSRYLDTDIFNPVNQMANTFSVFSSDRVVASLVGEWKILDNLTFSTTYSADYTYAIVDDFAPSYFLSINDQRPINSVVKQHLEWKNWQWDNLLTYLPELGEKHDMSILLGTSARTETSSYTGAGRDNLRFNDPFYAYLDNGDINRTGQFSYGGVGENSLLSYFGRVNYDFVGKYQIGATMRVDGSSNFGVNNRYGYFPSVSAGWIVSEEAFLSSVEAINFLKVRASWGRNGNQRIPAFQYISLISTGTNGNGNGGSYSYHFGPGQEIVTGSAPSVRPNPDIQWETSTQFDIGIDVGLLNDKLYFTADYYVKTTEDMLVNIPALGHVGALNAFVNAGTVRNTGLELSGEFRQLEGAWTWSLGGNIAFLTNELTSLGNGGTPIPTGFLQQANGFVARTDIGNPIGSFYGFETDGIFQDAEEVANHAFQSAKTAPGDLRYVDQNGDDVINDLDRTYIGNPTPDFTYGMTGNLAYGGFDLSVFVQGVQGNDIYRGFTRLDFENVNVPVSRLNRWTGPGTSDTEPRVVVGDPNQNARVSDYFIEDGSFLRIKTVQLGYKLPTIVTQALRVKQVRAYVSGQNVFTFTQYSGLDPEIGTRGALEIGIDRGFYPQPRIWLGGIDITFQ